MEQSEYYALRVALQTMKERCISLQRRLATVEDENQQLRERLDDNATTATVSTYGSSGGAVENIQLRMQVAELHHQKGQLNEHITMISNENRKLWSRLSQISKEQGKTMFVSDNDSTLMNEPGVDVATSPRGSANQNLIRSKTFTQHSPNPNLRHKLVPSDATADLKDISLEEEALEAYQENKSIVAGASAGAGAGAGDGAGEEYADATEAELAFAYLNIDESSASANDNDSEFNLEAKKCIEGLQEIRLEAMKQQQQLNLALTALEGKIALKPCPECALKGAKPEMADKSLETDESLNEVKFYNNNQLMNDAPAVKPSNPNIYNGHRHVDDATTVTEKSNTPTHMNIIQEKIKADAVDKMCPMCGTVYSSSVTFDAFKEHVEMHFVDDSLDMEASMERNFEFISHAVGDF